MTKPVIFIPARYASTRFPGKPLVELTGCNGDKRTLIERTWRVGCDALPEEQVFVTTDDVRIAEKARSLGATVLMTSENCRNGTERCAEALAQLDFEPSMVVNLQGDAPLTPPWFLSELINGLESRPEIEVATPVLRCDQETYANLIADRQNGRVGGTTAVFGVNNLAHYFSKEVVPYLPESEREIDFPPVFHHVGVYAYRPSALRKYETLPEGRLEQLEGLEQLRFIEYNVSVLCVEVDAKGRSFWELNNPNDTKIIEDMMNRMEIS